MKPYLFIKKPVDCKTSDFYDHIVRRQFNSLALQGIEGTKIRVLIDNAYLRKDNGIYNATQISSNVYKIKSRIKTDLKDSAIHLVKSDYENSDNTYVRIETRQVGLDPVLIDEIRLNDSDEDKCREIIVGAVLKAKKK